MRFKRQSRITEIIAEKRQQFFEAISSGLDKGEERMRQLVPVDEGDLESTIEKKDNGNGSGFLSVGGPSKRPGGKFVDYPKHVEYGTENMAAQPFFRPGVDAAEQEIKRKIKQIK